MTTVLLSIHEKYWNMIKSGKKTLEIRKTKPKGVDYPFRVLCYVTGGKGIQGSFTCWNTETTSILRKDILKKSCLTHGQLDEYAEGKEFVAWGVMGVQVFDKPMKLSEVGIKRAPQSWCYINK